MVLSIYYLRRYYNHKIFIENLNWVFYLAHKSCDTYLWTYDTFLLGRGKTIGYHRDGPRVNIVHRIDLKMNNMIPDTEMNEMTKHLFYNSAE